MKILIAVSTCSKTRNVFEVLGKMHVARLLLRHCEVIFHLYFSIELKRQLLNITFKTHFHILSFHI